MKTGNGKTPGDRAAGYDDHRDRMTAVMREKSAAGREIGPLPKVADPDRRNRGLDDPEFFHRTYFPARFYLGFGKPHRDAIRMLADCTEDGGLHALAMGRGFGKTTLCECEVMRALLYGLRRYVVFIGATDQLAGRAVKRIWRELETNDLLLEDFPEVCHPIRALERVNQRARAQTLDGVPTLMETTDGQIVLPAVPASAAAGGVVQAFGLTGAIKGLNMLAPDGTPIRPDMVVLDDCQTRESAKSPTQTADRERVICDDVLGLAGPRTRMAAVFLCTPIYPNDLTERFIDREKHPEWRGVRTRMVEAFPADMDAWDAYQERRRDELRNGGDGSGANALYAANRPAMDAGCVLAWPDRVKDGDVSAVQTAMHLYFDNPTGFKSEYQCEPDAGDAGMDSKQLDPERVAARTNGVERFAVPKECARLTAFIDCGKTLLWYAVVGWNERGGGGVVDYGCWPRQSRGMFEKADARSKLADRYPGLNEEQLTFAGLRDLTPEVLGRVYYRDGAGDELKVDRCLIDSGFNQSAVLQFVRQSPFANSLIPSKGMARQSGRGVGEWAPRPGERTGPHWRLTVGERSRSRQLVFDPDEWKSRVYGLLSTPPGDGCGLFLWGKSAAPHALIGEHLAAESSTPTPHRGGTFDKWAAGVDRRDNDLFDCLVGCAVAASFEGVRWSAEPGGAGPQPRPGAKKPWAEKYKDKFAAWA